MNFTQFHCTFTTNYFKSAKQATNLFEYFNTIMDYILGQTNTTHIF